MAVAFGCEENKKKKKTKTKKKICVLVLVFDDLARNIFQVQTCL
jgi:hypothetical protein